MTKSKFSYVTYIATTPEKLWLVLTEPQFIPRYWFNYRVECGWRKGSSWTLVKPGGGCAVTGEVLEIDPPRSMVIRWQDELRPELKAEGPSRFSIKGERAGKTVKLTITHEIDQPDSKLICLVSNSWPMVLSNLKSLLETDSVALQAPFRSAYTPSEEAAK
jgi:uncharacterized protein YndB with AHSA1/START domain